MLGEILIAGMAAMLICIAAMPAIRISPSI